MLVQSKYKNIWANTQFSKEDIRENTDSESRGENGNEADPATISMSSANSSIAGTQRRAEADLRAASRQLHGNVRGM